MSQHTPGPWTYWQGDSRQWYVDAGGEPVASLSHAEHAAEANARLIAAAPKMLSLLQELIDIEGPQPGTSEWAAKVRAAIAEAKTDA
jgi:hypothetical protein